MRSEWPTCAPPVLLLVQLLQVWSMRVRVGPAVHLRSGQHVVLIRRVSTAIDGLTLFRQSVSFVRLALALWSSSTFCAMTAPFAFRHGPFPIRSRALTAPVPCVLR